MSSPKPKRPGTKHHDSFVHKIRKRHDKRHHADEAEHSHDPNEQEPLLREEHPDSASMIEHNADVTIPPPPSRFKTAMTAFGSSLKDSAERAKNRTVETAKKLSSTIKSSTHKTVRIFKNNPKRTLSVLCLILLLFCIGEAIDIFKHHRQGPVETNICSTPNCVHAASRILKNLHPSYQQMDPCKDFDRYVCGGFRMNHELGEDQGVVSTGTLIEDEIYTALRHLLERNETQVKEADKTIFVKVKNAYLACQDTTKIKEYGAKPLKGIIDSVRGYFTTSQVVLRKTPTYQTVLNPHLNQSIHLSAAVAFMTKLEINTFVSFSIRSIDRVKGLDLIVEPLKSIGLPAVAHYYDKDVVNEYTKAIEASLTFFYSEQGNRTAMLGRHKLQFGMDELAQGVVQFEISLANIAPSDIELIDPSVYSRISLEELDKAVPLLSLASVIRELSPLKHENHLVTIWSLKYLRRLSQVVAVTRPEVLQAFLVWKTTQAYADAIDDEVVNPWKSLQTKLSGKRSNDDVARACVSSVNSDFGWILSKFFIEDDFSQTAMQVAERVVADVKQGFGQILRTSDWMTSDDLDATILKLKHSHSRIGYPTSYPDIHNSENLEAYYNQVLIQNNTYFENKIQSARARVLRATSRLSKTTNETEWPITATITETAYEDAANEVFFPAAMIRIPLLYANETPSYLNFGAFGAIVGQEIAHGFDNIGSLYNENGLLGEWWSNHTRGEFNERAQCFESQYSSYTVDGPGGKLSINGSLTLRESLSDAGGLKAAYQAWMTEEAQKSSQILPGLNTFNQKQLFWLAYGNAFCSKANAEAMKQNVLMAPFLPQSVRLKGVVANSKHFLEAFYCPKKEPICELW